MYDDVKIPQRHYDKHNFLRLGGNVSETPPPFVERVFQEWRSVEAFRHPLRFPPPQKKKKKKKHKKTHNNNNYKTHTHSGGTRI